MKLAGNTKVRLLGTCLAASGACFLISVNTVGRAQAVPGLSSSSNVKEVVKLLKNYSGTNAANIYQIEQDLRRHPNESAEALVNVLDTNDPELKKHASQLLQRLSFNGQDFTLSDSSIKTLIGILKASDDSEVQSSLVQTLGNLGPKSDSIKQAIIDTLKTSPEVSVRRTAVDSLARLAHEERPALHEASTAILVDVLKHDDSAAVRAAAAGAMGSYRDNPAVAVPALSEALNDNYLTVRTRVAQSLGQYGPSAKAAVEKLVGALKSESDSNMRSSCMNALRQIDPENEIVIKELANLLSDPNQMVSQSALMQVYNIGPKGAAL